MSSEIGKDIRFSFFESGVVIDGLPAGHYIDLFAVRAFMARRFLPADPVFGREEDQKDELFAVSGLVDDVTCGAPLCIEIKTADEDEEDDGKGIQFISEFRPQAETKEEMPAPALPPLLAPICCAGGIAKTLLDKEGTSVGAHILELDQVRDKPFDPVAVSADDLADPGRYAFPCFHFGTGETMRNHLTLMFKKDRPFTAVLEAGVTGLAPGCGEPMFDGIENLLARAVFALPGVTGLGFGAGSKAASMRGSEHNDAFRIKDGAVTTATNHAGGILGGISNGMPLLLNVNVRTPLSAEGEGKRYQHLLIPALVPALESLIAMTLLDLTAHRFENR